MRRPSNLWVRSVLATALVAGIGAPGWSQTVVIEVNDTPADGDDYLCWNPVAARARLAAAGPAQTVTLRSASHAKLFAATRDDKLWARDPLLRDAAWQDVGPANDVVGMAGVGGQLFAATSDNRLWVRGTSLAPAPWAPIGHANNVVAMASAVGKLFAVTSDNRLWARDPVLADVAWQAIGTADNVVGLAAANGVLYAATRDNKLWMRLPVLANAPWSHIGHADNVVAMTGSHGRLFAATRDNRLWEREASPANLPWRPIGHANNVAALATASESGTVGFLAAPLPPGPPTSPRSTLSLSLPADGSWRSFFVAGRTPSTEHRDVAVIATDSAGRELGRQPVMVRVRKNAESLTYGERRRFLSAFAKAARNGRLAKYWGIHTDAGNMRAAHDAAFLPWHRALLLHIERELQLEDRSVALPYWEFDKPAPRLFKEDFIGRVGNGPIVTFSPSNPMGTMPFSFPLVRDRNGDTSVSSLLNKNFMNRPAHTQMKNDMWGPYHGQAHVYIGGVVGDINRSPADPLFFLLHANVDRAWGAWQRVRDRFDRTRSDDYGFQGSHTPGAPQPLGNYVDDTMWPWDGVARPGSTVVFTALPVDLPPNAGPGTGLSGAPEVGDTLDYLDLRRTGAAHGFCYDTLPQGTGPVAPFWP